ncbi:uncharacterized protein OCT59_001791 [Rhizophagus irregularis]|uniref:uncharacterized protein n=1 Tax=Rhizophagus irregularis TaxID=588596 RepID=UPI00331DAAA4|nr:hypothetical protein OCT59_001791 [Rhizophagus irregularis]
MASTHLQEEGLFVKLLDIYVYTKIIGIAGFCSFVFSCDSWAFGRVKFSMTGKVLPDFLNTQPGPFDM